jgi:hypothetical protein
MTNTLAHPATVQRKYAERIASCLNKRFFNEDGSVATGVGTDKFNASVVEDILRIMTPNFGDYVDDFESSNISGFSYDEIAHVLLVDFDHGSRYWYHGVESEVYKKLTESESKGKYFAAEIKPNCPYERIQ